MQLQFVIAVGITFGAFFTSFGIFLERRRVKALEAQKRGARLSMPERICGAWVYNDGKGRSHHCVLDHDHAADIHRSESGMGRKVLA
jgi:hypothetical protein